MAFVAGDTAVVASFVVSAAGVGTFYGEALDPSAQFGTIMTTVANVLFNNGTIGTAAAAQCRKVGAPDQNVINQFLGRFVQFAGAGPAVSGTVVSIFKVELATIGGSSPDTNILVLETSTGDRAYINAANATVVNR